jgi:hypothetical protein
MLTEKAQSDRKWGWLPELRSILEPKRVPEHYFGASSVSDNIFDWLRHLIEVEMLIQENRNQIIEKLHSEARDGVLRDLNRVRDAFRQAKSELEGAEERLGNVMRSVSQWRPDKNETPNG